MSLIHLLPYCILTFPFRISFSLVPSHSAYLPLFTAIYPHQQLPFEGRVFFILFLVYIFLSASFVVRAAFLVWILWWWYCIEKKFLFFLLLHLDFLHDWRCQNSRFVNWIHKTSDTAALPLKAVSFAGFQSAISGM